MPLHLLGKKSWNVYSPANIERVRRDEAAAAEAAARHEQLVRDVEAERRIAILRGEEPPPLPPPPQLHVPHPEQSPDISGKDLKRRRRRLAGEDDTDRDIRLAKEDAAAEEEARERKRRTTSSNAPITDKAGHINLFPTPRAPGGNGKDLELEAEKVEKRQESGDLYAMKFVDAVGRRGTQDPWYSSTKKSGQADAGRLEELGKDVWGNEDPRRYERERSRMAASDPLAFMQKAQAQLKQSEKDKQQWAEERAKEMQKLKEDSRDRKRRKEYHYEHEQGKARCYGGDDGELEGFSLDSPNDFKDGHKRGRGHESSRRHSRRHRSHSRDQDHKISYRSSKRSRSQGRDYVRPRDRPRKERGVEQSQV